MQQSQAINLIQLSDNMTNSKTDLLAYIEFYYGVLSDEYEESNFLIKTQSDLSKWFELWSGNPDEFKEANRELRQWKIEQNQMSKEEFVDLIVLDIQDAIETKFVQYAGNRVLFDLDKALGEDLTPEMLYERHMERPESRVECLI